MQPSQFPTYTRVNLSLNASHILMQYLAMFDLEFAPDKDGNLWISCRTT
jgi:hypothetical protein